MSRVAVVMRLAAAIEHLTRAMVVIRLIAHGLT
jgi:hypothetical protein